MWSSIYFDCCIMYWYTDLVHTEREREREREREETCTASALDSLDNFKWA